MTTRTTSLRRAAAACPIAAALRAHLRALALGTVRSDPGQLVFGDGPATPYDYAPPWPEHGLTWAAAARALRPPRGTAHGGLGDDRRGREREGALGADGPRQHHDHVGQVRRPDARLNRRGRPLLDAYLGRSLLPLGCSAESGACQGAGCTTCRVEQIPISWQTKCAHEACSSFSSCWGFTLSALLLVRLLGFSSDVGTDRQFYEALAFGAVTWLGAALLIVLLWWSGNSSS